MAEESVKTFTINIARPGADISVVNVVENDTIERALELAGLKINRGEIVSRDGVALQMSDAVKENDVLFLEQNDENGR